MWSLLSTDQQCVCVCVYFFSTPTNLNVQKIKQQIFDHDSPTSPGGDTIYDRL